jgi:polar amino acid transport system permease protein
MGGLSNWPWWAIIAAVIGLFIAILILTNTRWTTIFVSIAKSIPITLTVGGIGYAMALIIGLIVGLGRVSKNVAFYNGATLYVEVIRGVPILVLLLYIAFVGAPLMINAINAVGEWLLALNVTFLGEPLADLSTRDFDMIWRATIALGVAYGAFSAEIWRAGIESIEKGQMEAARSLGMTYSQSMRHIILPQAVRRVLPAMGNDFVAMIKDSSLVSVLGVNDITQTAKLYAASTFLFFQTYSILAFMYLLITVSLTRLVRLLERRLRRGRT